MENATLSLAYAHAYMFAMVSTVGIGFDIEPKEDR